MPATPVMSYSMKSGTVYFRKARFRILFQTLAFMISVKINISYYFEHASTFYTTPF